MRVIQKPPSVEERRVVMIRIDRRHVGPILSGAARLSGVPVGAFCVGMNVALAHDAVDFILKHDSFAPVAEGCCAPEIEDVTITYEPPPPTRRGISL